MSTRFAATGPATNTDGCSSTASTRALAAAQPQPDATETLQKPAEVDEKEIRQEGPGQAIAPLGPKRGRRWYRNLRWQLGSVYRRLFGLALAANVVALLVLATCQAHGSGPSLTHRAAAQAATANLFAGLLVRNEHVVNGLFTIFVDWSSWLPLRVRRVFAKVYTYGGMHSSAGVVATCWQIAFVVLLSTEFLAATGERDVFPVARASALATGCVVLGLLVCIIVFAHPSLRVRWHNAFERVHRFLGWMVLALCWVQTVLVAFDAHRTRLGPELAAEPAVWMLLGCTLLVAYPWTRLRRRPVRVEALSPHCVRLHFDYARVRYGQAVRLTDAPLSETHAFAAIPPPGSADKRFSVLVSDAGDWTRRVIGHPPKDMFTRGAPQFGVVRVCGLFSSCLVVATGSGIGPLLALFAQKPAHQRLRVLWCAPRPLATFGAKVVGLVIETDPDAVIVNTVQEGRPDLVSLVWNLWTEGRHVEAGNGLAVGPPLEAVVVISNRKVTRKVVYGLESRGVPAYGAIFDS